MCFPSWETSCRDVLPIVVDILSWTLLPVVVDFLSQKLLPVAVTLHIMAMLLIVAVPCCYHSSAASHNDTQTAFSYLRDLKEIQPASCK